MNVFVNGFLQFLGVVVLLANQASNIVPEKYKALVAGVAGIAMGLVAVVSHFRNPDGTKAEVPYDSTRDFQ